MQYISIHDEDTLDELDLDEYELIDSAYAVSKASGINVLRDKELHTVVLDDSGIVVGALFTGVTGNEFSFDVAVLPEHQSKGIGNELTSTGMYEYDMYSDMDNFRLKLDVVNPRYAEYLMKRYGLKKEAEEAGHIILTDSIETESDLLESFIHMLYRKEHSTLIESILAGYRTIFEVASPKKPKGARKFKRIKNAGSNTAYELFGKKFKTSRGNVVEVIFIPESDDWYEAVFTVNDSYDDDATIGKDRDPEIFSGVIYLIRQIADDNGIDKIQIKPREGKGDKKIVKDLSIDEARVVLDRELAKYEKSLDSASYPDRPSESISKILEKRGREWNASEWFMGPIKRDLEFLHTMLSRDLDPSTGKQFISLAHTMKPNDRIEGISFDGLSNALRNYGESLLSNTESGLEVEENRREKVYTKLLARHMTDWDISKSMGYFELVRK